MRTYVYVLDMNPVKPKPWTLLSVRRITHVGTRRREEFVHSNGCSISAAVVVVVAVVVAVIVEH